MAGENGYFRKLRPRRRRVRSGCEAREGRPDRSSRKSHDVVARKPQARRMRSSTRWLIPANGATISRGSARLSEMRRAPIPRYRPTDPSDGRMHGARGCGEASGPGPGDGIGIGCAGTLRSCRDTGRRPLLQFYSRFYRPVTPSRSRPIATARLSAWPHKSFTSAPGLRRCCGARSG